MPSIMVIKDEGDALIYKIQRFIEEEAASSNHSKSDEADQQDQPYLSVDGDPGPTFVRPKLSRREAEVLQYLAMGLTPDQMALKMGLSASTIRKHFYSLRGKFHTNSRDQLMAMAGYLRLCNPYQQK